MDRNLVDGSDGQNKRVGRCNHDPGRWNKRRSHDGSPGVSCDALLESLGDQMKTGSVDARFNARCDMFQWCSGVFPVLAATLEGQPAINQRLPQTANGTRPDGNKNTIKMG